MQSRRTRILLEHMKIATREPNQYAKFAFDGSRVDVWYILLSGFAGDDDEYTHNGEYGEYLCVLTAPENYPFAPPSFKFLTPNGVYDVGAPVCISVGEYHPENYRPTLGMDGFIMQVVSGLVGWKQLGAGIALMKTSLGQKIKLAGESRAYNREHHGEIITMIEQAYADYSSRWNAAM